MRHLVCLLLIAACGKGGAADPDADWNGFGVGRIEENRRWAAEQIPKLQDPAYGEARTRKLHEVITYPASPGASARCGNTKLDVSYHPLTEPGGSLYLSVGVEAGPALPDRLRIDGTVVAHPQSKPMVVSYDATKGWPTASFDVDVARFRRQFPRGERTLTLETRVNVLSQGKYTTETRRWRLRMRVFDAAELKLLQEHTDARALAYADKDLRRELAAHGGGDTLEELRRQPTAEIAQYVELFDRRVREAPQPPPPDHPVEALRRTLTLEPIGPC